MMVFACQDIYLGLEMVENTEFKLFITELKMECTEVKD